MFPLSAIPLFELCVIYSETSLQRTPEYQTESVPI